MIAYINIYLGFIEEVEKLMKYPEITSSDTVYLEFQNLDIVSRNPKHNGKYDERLFDALANHVRKLFILHKEPISLNNIHDKASIDFLSDPDFNKLDKIYNQIKKYLNCNMNSVMQFSFSFPGSLLDKTTVFELLNNYFAATMQHSKPNAQLFIDEINSLTFGTLPEMVRVMVIDLIKLISEYISVLRFLLNK